MKTAEKKAITLASLKKIYEELPKLAETMPSIKDEFDMTVYGAYCGLKSHLIEPECETYGCGLGNSARLFELKESDFYYKKFKYDNFGKRILPSCYSKDDSSVTKEKKLWNFLFSSTWDDYQPSFEQFIQRVKYAIDMDLEIGNWKYQKFSFIK